MTSRNKVYSDKPASFNKDEIIRSNNIIEVARELGIKVNKNVIPCIKIEDHVNIDGPPTMSFNPVSNTYRCWVCKDVGGTVIDLVTQMMDITEEKAMEYLAIRSETSSLPEKGQVLHARGITKLDRGSRESIFQQFISGIEDRNGIDLIAFASIKGGTGKSLVVNNLSVLVSLIARYIGLHKESEVQRVELIDLDFGKPDQRILFNREPEHYIEDVFYNKDAKLSWEDIRGKTPIDNLDFISPCPVRRSNSLYYLNKNEILYMLHNSDALIKLSDFGGGLNKDSLDFLSNIKNKIFVINPDRTSIEAVFNLILSLIYSPLKNSFKANRDAANLLENLRNHHRTGFTVRELRKELDKIDKMNGRANSLNTFYNDLIAPLKKQLELSELNGLELTLSRVREEIPILRERVNQIMFSKNGVSGKFSYTEKSKIYKRYSEIQQTMSGYSTHTERLEDMLKVSLFGLIINKCDKNLAQEIKDELIYRIENALSMKMTYLGNIPEDEDLRNVSNYDMPFAVSQINNPVLNYFFDITDKIIGLKAGSTEKIIEEQKGYIYSLKAQWQEHSRTFEYH
ncbi:MAG: hypothetical protein GY863_11440 [bacterium]|nr:hypothetical protein [bacterium]